MSSANPQVRARQLWGSDVYTEDSDLVAVLMHTGYYSIGAVTAPPSIKEARAATPRTPAPFHDRHPDDSMSPDRSSTCVTSPESRRGYG